MPNPLSSKFSLSFSLPHGFADLFCGYPRIFTAALWKGSMPHLCEFLDFDVVYAIEGAQATIQISIMLHKNTSDPLSKDFQSFDYFKKNSEDTDSELRKIILCKI
jgi:hypothetical protein